MEAVHASGLPSDSGLCLQTCSECEKQFACETDEDANESAVVCPLCLDTKTQNAFMAATRFMSRSNAGHAEYAPRIPISALKAAFREKNESSLLEFKAIMSLQKHLAMKVFGLLERPDEATLRALLWTFYIDEREVSSITTFLGSANRDSLSMCEFFNNANTDKDKWIDRIFRSDTAALESTAAATPATAAATAAATPAILSVEEDPVSVVRGTKRVRGADEDAARDAEACAQIATLVVRISVDADMAEYWEMLLDSKSAIAAQRSDKRTIDALRWMVNLVNDPAFKDNVEKHKDDCAEWLCTAMRRANVRAADLARVLYG